MTTIRLRGPEDLLTTLPYQLGYQPTDSAVVVVLHGRRMGMVARVDLPLPEQVPHVVETVVPPVLRESPGEVLVVGYETVEGDSEPVLDALADAFEESGVVVGEVLVVRDDRWYSLDCDEPCCPPHGRPLPAPDRSAAAADYVSLEVAPLADRDQLVASVAAVEPLAGRVAAELATHGSVAYAGQAVGVPAPPVGRELAVCRMQWLSVWARLLDVRFAGGDPDLTADQVATLVRSLADVQLRDGLIAWTCPGSLPLDHLDEDLLDLLRSCLPRPHWAGPDDRAAAVAGHRVVHRLQWLARAVPDAHCAGALTVLAQFAWWLGSGALARVALDRALEHHPAYRLALLLERMVVLAIRQPRADGPGDPSTHRTRLSAG